MYEEGNCLSSLKQKGVLFGYIENIMFNSLRNENLNLNNDIDNVDNVLSNLWIFNSAKKYMSSKDFTALIWFCNEILNWPAFPTMWEFNDLKNILEHYYIETKVDVLMFRLIRDKKTLDKISLIWDIHITRDISKLSYELYNFYVNDNLLDSEEKSNIIRLFPELWIENQFIIDQVIDSKKHISDIM